MSSVLPTFLDTNAKVFPIFPTVHYTLIDDILKKPDNICPICLRNPKTIYRPNSCNHYFCKKCLKHWISVKKNCPVCIKQFNNIIKI